MWDSHSQLPTIAQRKISILLFAAGAVVLMATTILLFTVSLTTKAATHGGTMAHMP